MLNRPRALAVQGRDHSIHAPTTMSIASVPPPLSITGASERPPNLISPSHAAPAYSYAPGNPVHPSLSSTLEARLAHWGATQDASAAGSLEATLARGPVGLGKPTAEAGAAAAAAAPTPAPAGPSAVGGSTASVVSDGARARVNPPDGVTRGGRISNYYTRVPRPVEGFSNVVRVPSVRLSLPSPVPPVLDPFRVTQRWALLCQTSSYELPPHTSSACAQYACVPHTYSHLRQVVGHGKCVDVDRLEEPDVRGRDGVPSVAVACRQGRGLTPRRRTSPRRRASTRTAAFTQRSRPPSLKPCPRPPLRSPRPASPSRLRRSDGPTPSAIGRRPHPAIPRTAEAPLAARQVRPQLPRERTLPRCSRAAGGPRGRAVVSAAAARAGSCGCRRSRRRCPAVAATQTAATSRGSRRCWTRGGTRRA